MIRRDDPSLDLTADDFIRSTREAQHAHYAGLDDDARNALDRALTIAGHAATIGRVRSDMHLLASTAPNLKAERDELASDFEKTREHSASPAHAHAEGK